MEAVSSHVFRPLTREQLFVATPGVCTPHWLAIPFTRIPRPIWPLDPGETLFFDYHRQNQVQIKVMRIYNTYGPRMHPDDGRVVSNFIVPALRGEPITVYGDGSQTRCFCYVDD